jgi:GT2 family glycosyltransferase
LTSPTINIVVLNYNTRNLLQQCLPIVIRNSQYPGATVTVVDNASTDGSAEFLREHHFKLLDNQYLNDHIAQFGAYEISHKKFLEILEEALDLPED